MSIEFKLFNDDCVNVLQNYLGKIDLIITSPPYDDLRKYGGHEFKFQEVATVLANTLKPGGIIAWNVWDSMFNFGYTGTSMRQCLYFMSLGLTLHEILFFRRSTENAKNPTRYTNVTEFIFILSNGRPKTFNPIKDKKNITSGQIINNSDHGRNKDGLRTIRKQKHYITPEYSKRNNIWTYNVGGGQKTPDSKDAQKHPATFPLAMAKDLVLSYSNPGDLVLDPMAGSGTTIRAAIDLGRNAIGIEIHNAPGYFPAMESRMAQRTLFGDL